MAQITFGQSNFNQGELGPFMEGRADNEVYRRALSIVENWIVVPQGGLLRRPGFEFVHDVKTSDSLNTRLTRFSFNKQQEYVQLWRERQVLLFRQKSLVSTVPTPFSGEETRILRLAQSGDVQILTHFNHDPQLLERLGSDTAWGISELIIDPLPFFQFNRSHSFTVAPTTQGVDRQATLSGSEEGYWNAGHFGNDIQIRLVRNAKPEGEASDAVFFTLTRPGQDAIGGIPLSSAGTAANAFDGSDATQCEAGLDGWIGYDLDPAKRYALVGLRSSLPTRDYSLVFETAEDAAFTEPTVVATAAFTLGAEEWVYIDLPRYTAKRYFRLREDGGNVLTVTQLIFNEGLVAIGDLSANLPTTLVLPTKVWPEQAWGTHHGYPRTVEFIGNRLAFGGTRDEPATIFFGKDGDLFNFDDNKTLADSAFSRTLSTDENHFIRDMKAERDGLVIFTSDGVFNLDGDGAPITPTNVSIEPQVRIGVSQVAVAEVDGNLIYVEANGKQISSIAYSFGADQYVTDSKTTLAHHLFTDVTRPRAMAGLRAFKDTQANLLFVPREDGEMAVLTQDESKQVLGWSRFKTFNPDGALAKFRDAAVVETDHGAFDASGVPITVPTLYALVERTVDGKTQTFLEALTEEDVYLDHWYVGEVVNKEVSTVEIFKPGTGYEVDDILTVENTSESRHIVFVDDTGYLIDPAFDMPADNFTIEVEFDSIDETRDCTPLSYATGDGPQANAIVLNRLDSLDILIGDTKVSTGLKLNDGVRHRLTLSYFSGIEPDQLFLYDNGQPVLSAPLVPKYPLTPGGTLVLGQEQDSHGGGFDPSQAFVGGMHRFRIWSRALNFDEIARGRSNDPADLHRDFRFNEGKGTTTVDEVSGTALSLHGGVQWTFAAINPPEKATVKVTDVDPLGAITGLKVRTGGDYSAVPQNPVIVTGGSGIDAEVNLTFRTKPKADWSGIDTLPNSEITVVGDGFVVGEAQVDDKGNFTIGAPVEHINAGLGYPSFGETMKLALISGGQVVRGKNMVLKEAVMDFDKTLAFEVNGYPVYFRTWDNFVFETGLVPFTGQKRAKISNRGSAFQRDPKVNFSVTQPVAAHLLSLTLEVNIGV